MSNLRPFSILGIQQIAVGGADKQKLRSFWVDLLGLSYRDTFVSESENGRKLDTASYLGITA